MSEKKNIDRLFQEKFKDFEVSAPEKAWENIEAQLNPEKKKRKVIPLWFKLSGIAAALLIGFFTTDGFKFGNRNDNPVVIEENNTPGKTNTDPAGSFPKENNAVTDNDHTTGTVSPEKSGTANEKDIQNTVSDPAGADIVKAKPEQSVVNTDPARSKKQQRIKGLKQDNAVAHHSGSEKNKDNRNKNIKNRKQQTAIAGTDKDKQNKAKGQDGLSENANTAIADQNNAKDKIKDQKATDAVFGKQPDSGNKPDGTLNKNQIIAHNDDEKIDTTAIATVVPNPLEELLNEKEKTTVTPKESKLNRWQVTPQIAPIYFSSASNGSPIDSKLSENGKNFENSVGVGIGVSYALNKKFTLRTGVNSLVMEYNTQGIVFSQNTNARKLEHVKPNMQGSFIQVENKPSAEIVDLTSGNQIINKFGGELNQKTGFIEVPVELSYKVLDKKFGIEVIGGFSTLFLNKNEISIRTDDLNMEIGEASNLNDMHFSTNVGLGFKYSFFKSFQANFEPMFKYQINTFTNDGNFKPYFFGLYTGISYRF